jgi:hypothetical protein
VLANGLGSFSNLMLVAQAPGAQVKPFWLTIYDDGSWVDIRHPAAVGVALGVTDVMTKLRRFPA